MGMEDVMVKDESSQVALGFFVFCFSVCHFAAREFARLVWADKRLSVRNLVFVKGHQQHYDDPCPNAHILGREKRK